MNIINEEQLNEKEKKEEELKKKALFMGTWLTYLFWLAVPMIISRVLTSSVFAEYIPMAYLIGEILLYIISFAYCVILFRLSEADRRYCVAGLCMLVSTVLTVVASRMLLYFWYATEGRVLWLLAVLFECMGTVVEFTAYADNLKDIDNRFAGKWRAMRIIAIICYVVLAASTMGAAYTRVSCFSIIMMLVSLAITVLSLIQFIYLYKTAALFNGYRGE